jgi:endonuclease/exonuclease/phosphatase family metal-dependent hydrolase
VRVQEQACAGAPVDGAGQVSAEAVRWLDHAAAEDRVELDRWCRGVGVPVVATAATTGPVRADSVVVITWNVHLGAARIDAFVADLRAGVVTGRPVEHFVLLLQEARRNSAGVPAPLPSDARAARRLGARDFGSDVDIVDTARRLGLGLFYAPSMRNGGRAEAPEDRGNAILTALPLESLTAIELPLLAQRRVAVAATIPLLGAAGERRALRVTSVHLDLGANRHNLLAPFGPGRKLQASALADALEGEGNHVVGGDFNFWTMTRLEGGLTIMQTRFPHFPDGQDEPTFYTAGILPRQLDHLFLRAADVSGAAPVRIGQRYGSDHYPVMAWIRL